MVITKQMTREQMTREQMTRKHIIRKHITREHMTREQLIRENMVRKQVIAIIACMRMRVIATTDDNVAGDRPRLGGDQPLW